MQASYDFLRAARALLDITPTDLAEKAKVSKRSIVRIEAREPVGLEISLRVQKALEELGAIVDDVPVYKTIPETEDLNGAAAKLLESGADWITFTSSSTVEHFHARFDLAKLLKQFPSMRTVSIGPETTRVARGAGVDVVAEARTTDVAGLVAAARSALTGR